MESLLIPYRPTQAIGKGEILIFAPHSDDEVFGCGGAIAKHVRAGDTVHVIVLTDGAAQHRVDNQDTNYTNQRQAESIAAAEVLGYKDIEFWDIPDRGVLYSEKLAQRFESVISNKDISLVYAPSILEAHPDHRSVAMLAVEAVRRQERDVKLAMYEVGVAIQPNTLLDITNVSEIKERAMECFESQLKVQAYNEHMSALNRYRSYTLPPNIKSAEAYFVVDAKDLKDDPLRLYQPEYIRQRELGLQFDANDSLLVSVIVRSVDRPTLSDALNSIALQTYSNIEVVVINAKGDGHVEVGEWCGRFPIKMYGEGKSLNRAEAANYGLDNSRGKYLIFLDDDDLYEPDHIAGLVKAFDSNSSYKAIYSAVKVRDERTKTGGDESGTVDMVFSKEYDPASLLVTNYIPNNSIMFDHDILNNECRFDEELNVYEDWDFLIKISMHTQFLHIKNITSIYRIADGNGIGVHPGSLVEQEEILTKFFNKWRALWPQEKFLDVIRLAARVDSDKFAGSVYNLNLDLESAISRLIEKDDIIKDKTKLIELSQEQLSKTQANVKHLTNRISELELTLSNKEDNLKRIHNSFVYKVYKRLKPLFFFKR